MIEQVQQLVNLIEQDWPSRRLLIVGDVMLDKYIWGEVARISPEAPVPVVRATRQSEQPGGAANVALNLARLGAQVVVVGFTGGDENQHSLATCLRAAGVEPAFIETKDFPTITKLRILGGRQQMLRLDSERIAEHEAQDGDRLIARALEELPRCHAVVLSDYAKGVLNEKVCQRIIGEARRRGIPVLVDPKSADFNRYRGATTICPNLGELARAVDVPSHEFDALLAAAESLVQDFDLEFLTATLSEKGIALIRPGRTVHAPALARQVFDVSGAGDTVVATLALCLASGIAPETGVQVANLAAGIVVGKVGTMPIERQELLAALEPQLARTVNDKVLTLAQLVSRVALWREGGERIVFTNGYFEQLQVGHIALFEQARQFGDRLIVAINSDDSLCARKGFRRPAVAEALRARLLAALSPVDAVVVFDAPTPLELIVQLRPDALVKGGDYRRDTIVGAEEVESWGGQVRIVATGDEFSTSAIPKTEPVAHV